MNKYIKLFEEKFEYFDLMTMQPEKIIQILKDEIEKKDCDIEYIKDIIQWGHFNIDTIIDIGTPIESSLLLIAVAFYKYDVVELFMDAGANPNLELNGNGSALLYGIKANSIKSIEMLLKYPNTNPNLIPKNNSINNINDIPLYRALTYNHMQIFKALLNNPQIDPNITNIGGFTTLMYSAREGILWAVRELLKHPKIDVNYQKDDGWNALMLASYNLNSEIIKELLDYPGIDVSLTNEDKDTAWILTSNTIRYQFPKLNHNNR